MPAARYEAVRAAIATTPGYAYSTTALRRTFLFHYYRKADSRP